VNIGFRSRCLSIVDKSQPTIFFFYDCHTKLTYFSSPIVNLRKLIKGKGTELICKPNRYGVKNGKCKNERKDDEKKTNLSARNAIYIIQHWCKSGAKPNFRFVAMTTTRVANHPHRKDACNEEIRAR